MRCPSCHRELGDREAVYQVSRPHALKARSRFLERAISGGGMSQGSSMSSRSSTLRRRAHRLNHVIMVTLYTVCYNYVKQHKSLKGLSPAMAAGINPTLWEMKDLAEMVG